MKGLLWIAAILILCAGMIIPASPQAFARDDSLHVLPQPGGRAYECCYTFVIYNKRTAPDSTRVSQFRVRLLSEKGRFITGQGGAPFGWSIFLEDKEVFWLSNTTEAEIDTGESLPSFRACVRDTGVYRIVWETMNLDSVMTRDTLVLICTSRDNCDDAFFDPVPSNARCGFDIDLVSENGLRKEISDFNISVLSNGMTLDSAGMKTPPGWRLDRFTNSTVTWKIMGDPISSGNFVEDFRIFVNTNGLSTTRLAWWTAKYGEFICTDTVTLDCGLEVVDSLYIRKTMVGEDTCCMDFLLVNTHVPRSPLKSFRLAMNTPKATFRTPPALPNGWSFSLNSAGDTATITLDSLLAPGDSVLFSGLCFDNDLSPVDSVKFVWQTRDPELTVTEGLIAVPCFRDVVFCDSISARVDSALFATERCITLNVANRNSRRDNITRITANISNPGAMRRILNAKAPTGWSVESIAPDSVVYHRGTLRPGENLNALEFCVNIDTNAFDPLTIQWTTWATASRPICTGEIDVNARVDRECDSVGAVENEQSIDPFCCFDIVFKNNNDREVPIDAIQLRLPRIDLVFDTATAMEGSWQVSTNVFPNIRVDYNGDVLLPGESATFSFCVNAVAVKERPFSFRIVWRTFSQSNVVCFDTITVSCEGAPGRCDTIELTDQGVNEEACHASFRVENTHLPESLVDNVQFRILSPESASFVSGSADGSAAEFDQVQLSPGQVVFRGSAILPGETAENFTLEFDVESNAELEIEVCTFEGDREICCETQTVQCVFTGVGDFATTGGTLEHSAHPNPFEKSTEIRYSMKRPGGVTLVLLDEQGREVRRWSQGLQTEGTHAVRVEGNDLPSGVYYYVLQAGDERGTGRLVLVK